MTFPCVSFVDDSFYWWDGQKQPGQSGNGLALHSFVIVAALNSYHQDHCDIVFETLQSVDK